MSLFGKNDKIQRSFSRFNDEAYSGRFRKDGKLVVAGDKAGLVFIDISLRLNTHTHTHTHTHVIIPPPSIQILESI